MYGYIRRCILTGYDTFTSSDVSFWDSMHDIIKNTCRKNISLVGLNVLCFIYRLQFTFEQFDLN